MELRLSIYGLNLVCEHATMSFCLLMHRVNEGLSQALVTEANSMPAWRDM